MSAPRYAKWYRKRPLVIQAMRWDPDDNDVVGAVIAWLMECEQQATIGESFLDDAKTLCILTLEGEMTASPGAYIVRGIKGEFYPCKPDIFEQTYELIEGDDAPTAAP